MRLIARTLCNDEKAYDTPECYRKSETLETMVIFGKRKTMQGYKNENLTHFLLLKFRKLLRLRSKSLSPLTDGL